MTDIIANNNPMVTREEIIEKMQRVLDSERFAHSLRVERTAVALARRFKLSTEKAGLAGLLHDYSRQLTRLQMLAEAERLGLAIDPISRQEPKILHAELSAHYAQKDFGINDEEVLSAIRKHTLGTPAMAPLEEIIYIADHLEEGREFEGVAEIRRLAENNLDQAIAAISSSMIEYLKSNNLPVHPAGTATRDYYQAKA